MKCFRFIFLIIPFLFSCNESKTTVKGGIKSIPYNKRILVAVGTIENKTGDTSHNATLENATGIFISELDSTECFRLIERQRIKTILEEQKLGMAGIIDPSKTKEVGKILGADAILLIANVLDLQKLNMLISIARDIGLDCLVEVHNENDLNKAIASNAEIIGINNRDLNTFTVDLKTTADLVRLIPNDKIVVSESGISSSKDVEFLKKLRVNAMLVGESLMASKDIAKKIKQLTTDQEEHDERNKSFSE